MIISIFAEKALDKIQHLFTIKNLNTLGIREINLKIIKKYIYKPSANYWYADQEATVRTGHGTKDWFQIGKGVHRSCILSPCLFNLYAQYIMRNAGLEETQVGVKIAGRNINNLRDADDTTLMAES